MDAPRDHTRVHGGRALRGPTGWPSGPVLQGLRFRRAGALAKRGRLEVMAAWHRKTTRHATSPN
jgi:hypothetical protein